MSRPSVVTRRQQGGSTQPVLLSDVDPRRSHIFDGHTLSKETAAFQLCDIEDGLLKGLVETEDVRDSCNVRAPSFFIASNSRMIGTRRMVPF